MQLESLASFSAVIDRLGEFDEIVTAPKAAQAAAAQPASAASQDAFDGAAADAAAAEPTAAASSPAMSDAAAAAVARALGERIQITQMAAAGSGPAAGGGGNGDGGGGDVLLELDGVTLRTPDGGSTLIQNLDIQARFC